MGWVGFRWEVRMNFGDLRLAKQEGRQKHSELRQAGRAVAPNLAIECTLFRIPLAGGIDGTNPWYNSSHYDRRINDLMDVVTLQCNAHQTDVHFRQVIVPEDDSYHCDDNLFECFVLFVVHNAVSISAA